MYRIFQYFCVHYEYFDEHRDCKVVIAFYTIAYVIAFFHFYLSSSFKYETGIAMHLFVDIHACGSYFSLFSIHCASPFVKVKILNLFKDLGKPNGWKMVV